MLTINSSGQVLDRITIQPSVESSGYIVKVHARVCVCACACFTCVYVCVCVCVCVCACFTRLYVFVSVHMCSFLHLS